MNLSNNNFKQALVALFLIGASSSNLFAQGAYFNVNVGYGFPINSQTDQLSNVSKENYDNYLINESYSIEKVEVVNLNLGKGLNFGGSFGYMFNKNIGAELGLNYLLGGSTESKDESSSRTTSFSENSYSHSSSTTKMSSNMFQINPSIVLATGFEKLNPYAKFGVVLGFGSIKELNEYSNSNGGSQEYELIMNGGMAFGFSGSFGTQFSINDKLSLFGELNLNSLVYSPTKGEYTNATINGIDDLPGQTKSETNFEFVDNTTTTYEDFAFPTTSDPDQPSQLTKTSFQYSSIGLKFGITLKL